MKSREDVEKLKWQWKVNPIWDIETTEGFEEYHDELLAYSNQCKAEWKEKLKRHHEFLASKLCPMSFSSASMSNQHCFVERCAWWDSNRECCWMLPLRKEESQVE